MRYLLLLRVRKRSFPPLSNAEMLYCMLQHSRDRMHSIVLREIISAMHWSHYMNWKYDLLYLFEYILELLLKIWI